ncbi:MAG: hypothetical protein FH748_12975 [Balneolaceae bacterium]|nr:hypothetical protein [Balneolaceae bacterium]
MDWVTTTLLISALVVIVFVSKDFSKKRIVLPSHDNIENWESLISASFLSEGREEATVKIIEFYSYGCGYCNVLDSSLTKLQNEFPLEVITYYKPIHMGDMDLIILLH